MSIATLNLPIYDIKFTVVKGREGLKQVAAASKFHAGFVKDMMSAPVSGATLMAPEGVDGFGEAFVVLHTTDLGVIAHEAYHLAIELIYWIAGEEPSYKHQEQLAHVSEYLFRQIAREMGYDLPATIHDVTLDV